MISKALWMQNWRKLLVLILMACLVVLPPGNFVASPQAKAPPNTTLIKQQVDRLGLGAKVKVELAGGKKLQGYIERIEEEAFLLDSERDASPKCITYNQAVQVKLAKLSYRATGRPNSVEARRVVAALGMGKHVMVKVAGGKKLRGHIQAIGADHFTLRPDQQAAPVQIAYNNVWQVGENLSRGQKIALIAAVAAVGVVLIAYWATHVDT